MNILLLTFKRDRGESLADALTLKGHNVVVDVTGRRDHSIITNLVRTATSFYRHRGRYDFVITESFDYNGLLAMALSFFDRIPYLLYVKGFYPQDAADTTNTFYQFIDRILSERIFSRARYVVYISDHLKTKYIKYFESIGRNGPLIIPSMVIHHSVGESFLLRGRKDEDTQKRVLYVGNLDFKGKARGVEFLLRVVEAGLPDCVTVSIVGDGKYLPSLRRQAEELGLSNVVFHGFLRSGELLKAYQESTIFVYPSYQDALPTVVMEAQAMGLPVIVTNTSGARELVIDGCTGYVCEPDVKSFHSAVLTLLADTGLRDKMSNSARVHVKEHLSWHATADQFDAIITQSFPEP